MRESDRCTARGSLLHFLKSMLLFTRAKLLDTCVLLGERSERRIRINQFRLGNSGVTLPHDARYLVQLHARETRFTRDFQHRYHPSAESVTRLARGSVAANFQPDAALRQHAQHQLVYSSASPFPFFSSSSSSSSSSTVSSSLFSPGQILAHRKSCVLDLKFAVPRFYSFLSGSSAARTRTTPSG